MTSRSIDLTGREETVTHSIEPHIVADLGRALAEADAARIPITAPGSEVLPTLADAYAVQRRFIELRSKRLNSAVAGYKVALTSPEAQAALRADHPVAGSFLATDILDSGCVVVLHDRFSPLIEVELVVRVRSDLPMSASREAIAANADVAAGLECPDSRYRDWFGGDFPVLSLPDVVADDCLAGLLVTGHAWLPADETSVTDLQADLFLDGEHVQAGTAQNVLGDPLTAVEWLSGHVAELGQQLTAGTVISSGTFTAPVVATPGRVRASFNHGLGDVRVDFVRAPVEAD